MERAKWIVKHIDSDFGAKQRKPILEEGAELSLITPEELATLGPGTQLFSIFGVSYIVGTDNIDGDTRGGFLAFGFKN